MLRYGITIFLSAFLLFEVQLILAKRILPWFGGAPAVWTTCMLFFQLLLLAGYAYAHGLAAHLSATAQRRLHLALLSASLVLLAILWTAWGNPILPDADWKPADSAQPVWRILVLLGASIGLPFFILSATNPLLQAWFSRSHPDTPPWRLYALSNLGSLLGLLGYPFLIEWLLPLSAQAWTWVFGYALFAAGIVASSRAPAIAPAPAQTTAMAAAAVPARASYLLWFALAAMASVLLLATTNQMTQEIAVIPFLWVLPLSLYLLSFILCFESERWYRRGPYAVALLLALAGIGVVLHLGVDLPIYIQIGAYTALLFVACMTLHGELARLKPTANRLTAYYLTITAGGAAGGLFVALFAPLAFAGYWELHLGLWGSAALLLAVWWRDRNSFLHHGHVWPAVAVPLAVLALSVYLAHKSLLDAGSELLPTGGWLALAAAVAGSALVAGVRRRAPVPAWAHAVLFGLALTGYGVALAWLARAPLAESIAQTRNFYGVLHVKEDNPDNEEWHRYRLMHGRITHGHQYRRWDLRTEPTSYYAQDSGIGLALLRHPRRPLPLHVGVIGLGAGSLAVYGNSGDVFRFYEINPDVVHLAAGDRALFSYLRDSEAATDVVLGDARLQLERERARDDTLRFDVLVVDAFSSDAIPVHLLTAEAIEVYLARLRTPDGVLALHITNRYLDLEPVVAALAERHGLTLRIVESASGQYVFESTWVLLAHGDALERVAGLAEASRPAATASVAPWRDDYSNLFRIIKW
ncbi:MAG: ferrichrome ABC transporter permease [Gammaproteobacteria bacterium]|nr:MAG: ferrichrome ABC transporter permease [Gammaproteobacteria bacterium]